MYINQKNIYLIPKAVQPQMVSHFCPISLCNAIYKVVGKVVANRIIDCIPKLVSPYQIRYVTRRNIHENIIIAKEVMHSINMHNNNGRKDYFIVKVDLSKACDKIS